MEKVLLIGLLCDVKQIGEHHYHSVAEEYTRAVVDTMNAVPVLIPVLADALNTAALLQRLDGLLLPGSFSNIDPKLYGHENEEPDPLRDPARDATAFATIKEAERIGLPIFAICRGFQEVNVVFGGTLYQRIQLVEGMNDHRENLEIPLAQQYEDAHPIALVEGGLLAQHTGKPTAMVNTLHQQGVQVLAEPLKAEGLAEDGLVEAFSSKNPDHFILGVQWHPEWGVTKHEFNLSLFKMFEQACKKYSANKI